MSNPVPSMPPGRPTVIPVEPSSGLWDRVSSWASENKTAVYTIAGVAVVITGAGAVYYLKSDSVRSSRNMSPTFFSRLGATMANFGSRRTMVVRNSARRRGESAKKPSARLPTRRQKLLLPSHKPPPWPPSRSYRISTKTRSRV